MVTVSAYKLSFIGSIRSIFCFIFRYDNHNQVMGLEGTVMDEARLQAYVNLIEQLLTCNDLEQLNKILQANQN